MKTQNNGGRDNNYEPLAAKKSKLEPTPSNPTPAKPTAECTTAQRQEFLLSHISTVEVQRYKFCNLFGLQWDPNSLFESPNNSTQLQLESIPTWVWEQTSLMADYDESALLWNDCSKPISEPVDNSSSEVTLEVHGSSTSHEEFHNETSCEEKLQCVLNTVEEKLQYIWTTAKETSSSADIVFNNAMVDLFAPELALQSSSIATFPIVADISNGTVKADL